MDLARISDEVEVDEGDIGDIIDSDEQLGSGIDKWCINTNEHYLRRRGKSLVPIAPSPLISLLLAHPKFGCPSLRLVTYLDMCLETMSLSDFRPVGDYQNAIRERLFKVN